MADVRPQAARSTYAGLFLIALATLMYEIVLTRIFSVTMWYHFAFVALSMAMFGMTVGALVVFLAPRWFPPERVHARLAASSLLCGALMVVCFLTQLSIPFLVHPSIVAIYSIALTFAVGALPFVASGIAVCLALTQFPRSISQLYAADLIGAATGCVLLIYLLRVTDGPTAVVAVGAIACVAAMCFARQAEGPKDRSLRRAAAVVTILLAAAAGAHTVLVQRQFPVLRVLWAKGEFEARPLYEKWNSYSRIRVSGNPNVPERPYARTLSAATPPDVMVHQLRVDIDVAASTTLIGFTGDLRGVEFLKYDVTDIGHYIRPAGDTLVVGTGGGRDVLAALVFGAKSVTGVEINRDILQTVNGRFGDFSGHLDRDPRVRFVNDEARSFIARSGRQYDFIQISLIDTWAATAAGAFVLSENAVYTTEAWRVFLEHLTEGGLLSVSRWYVDVQPGEMYRTVSLATAALQTIGVDRPRDHIALVRSRSTGDGQIDVGTLLVSRTPFAAADLDRLEERVRALDFDMVLSPRAARDTTLERLATGGDLKAFISAHPVNISPPTDDSPFFFQMLRLRDIFKLHLLNAGKSSINMMAVLVLGVLLGTVVGLSAICIFLPLKFAAGQDVLRGHGALVSFFAAIGLGFMLIETSQMQRLMIVLGHPTYGLSVVLFALLLGSGIGSHLTRTVSAGTLARSGVVRLTMLLVLLAAFGVLTPIVTHTFDSSTTPVRIAVAVAILFPLGVMMGMAFPLGMKVAQAREPKLTPWLWGVNGALSVCASVLAIVIALAFGISAAFWTGAVAYAAALFAFRRATVSRSAQPLG
jgi:predicted membrane-bound spermidine synthase